MKSFNPPIELPMMGLVNNYDGAEWRIKEMVQMLANPAARQNLIRDIVEYAVESHQAGIVVDFEEVPDASQAHFQQFIGALAPALHSVGLKVMIALPARDDDYDYEFFGKQCDAIVLMNYDQHWLTSQPGPIASQDWFVENLRQVFDVVPAQKIVVGIANYAYDWSEAPKKQYEPAAEFSIQEALLHAEESDADIEFDSTSLNPHYSYYDEHNHVHQVWMLDAITAYNELRASEKLGVQGTALWRLGSADTSMWPIWDATRPDDAARQKLDRPASRPRSRFSKATATSGTSPILPSTAAEPSNTMPAAIFSPTNPTKPSRSPSTSIRLARPTRKSLSPSTMARTRNGLPKSWTS